MHGMSWPSHSQALRILSLDGRSGAECPRCDAPFSYVGIHIFEIAKILSNSLSVEFAKILWDRGSKSQPKKEK